MLKTEINTKLPLEKVVALQIIVEEKPRVPNGTKNKYDTKISTQKNHQWATCREKTIRNF